VNKKVSLLLLLTLCVSTPVLFSQQKKVTVIVKTASIYAEASENSYEIDRAKLGDVLTLFEDWKGEKEWLYVIFRSKRWKGEVTGFIKSSFVTRGEIIPEEMIAGTTTEAEVKELEPDKEGKEERADLPSLKDLVKSQKKTEEPDEAKPEELESKAEAAVRKPEKTEPGAKKDVSESETVKPLEQDETVKAEETQPERDKEVPTPEALQPEDKKETEIEDAPEPVVAKVDTFLGETVISERRQIMPSLIVESESRIYALENILPPSVKIQVAEVQAKTIQEFKREEVFPPPPKAESQPEQPEGAITEEPAREPEVAIEARPEPEKESKTETAPKTETEPEPKDEPEAEPPAIPVTTVLLTESEMLPFRDIVPAVASTTETGAYAVIRTREEIPVLEPRVKDIRAAMEARQSRVEVEPYEIQAKEPEFPQFPVKAEEELPSKAEEVAPTEAKPEEAKEKKPAIAEKPEVIDKEKPEAESPPKDKRAGEQESPPPPQRKPPQDLVKPRLPAAKRVGPFVMSVGYGPSYGGIGAALQLNTKSGFSIHAGVGYYPAKITYSQFEWLENQVLFSAGIKYYFPLRNQRLRPYLNLQYGGLTVEAVQVPTGIWYGEKTYENVQKNLYGPSFLLGTEWRLGRMGINGALGVSYNTTEWEYWERNYFLNGEFALVVYF